VRSMIVMIGRVMNPVGFGGMGMSNAKSDALTSARGSERGKQSRISKAAGLAWWVSEQTSPAPPPSGLIHTSVRVAGPPPRTRREVRYPWIRLIATAWRGCTSLW